MRQKFVFVTAVAVCLTLALVPALASERTVDRYGDRTKAGKGVSPAGVTVEQYSDGQLLTNGASFGSNSTSNRAANIISVAAKLDGATAITMLQQIMMMDLESTDQNDMILSTAYELMADRYADAPSKQVMNLGMALQYASDSARRANLESQITALGGDIFSLAFNNAGLGNAYTTRDPGADDSCLGAVAVALPHSETMSITPAGDRNWRSFDLFGAPIDGSFVRLETLGEPTDDTTIGLWDDCPENGGTQIAFNDDSPTGGTFLSLIDTDCLAPGTYYVEVGGFFDLSTPDDFDLEIAVTGTCIVPVVDSFEPDDNRDNAASIGHPTATSGFGWGRTHKDIQARSLVPRGDFDHATIALTQNSLVRIGTSEQFPTFFNGFEGSTGFPVVDTIMDLLYENEPNYGGRCNQPDQGFFPVCRTDADCPDPLENPIPGFPPCIPFTAFGIPIFLENAIANNDDRSSTDFGSELLMCLPRTSPGTGSRSLQDIGGGFLVRVQPWHPPGSVAYVDPFDYEINVKNEVGCFYEQEPNSTLSSANPYEIGTTVSGMWDFLISNPYADADYYSFDVDETTALKFETTAIDSTVSDTTLTLFVGPDDAGDFFTVGVSDDNGGEGNLSLIIVNLPPASELLGNTVVDANYQMRVSSRFISVNWPYEMTGSLDNTVFETEPNDTEATANPFDVTNAEIRASIDPPCDYDTFTFDLEADTFVTIEETSGGDATIQITDCSGNVLGCDDDSGGPGFLSLIRGCLPAGTYCAQVRAFDPGITFDYVLETTGTGGCMPTDPPTMDGDGAFTCTDFDTCP